MTSALHNEDRVRRHTRPEINERIDRETDGEAVSFSGKSQDEISNKIISLNDEWDMERMLETNASVLALTGVFLGFFVHRNWLFLSMLVLGFLLQHAVQGWCPPVSIFRRLGVRTRQEIDREIYILKGLRGDFDKIKEDNPVIKARIVLESVKK